MPDAATNSDGTIPCQLYVWQSQCLNVSARMCDVLCMGFDYLRSAFKACKCRVSDAASFTLLLALANHANNKDGKSFAKMGVLAETCRMDERTTRRKLRALEEAGLVVVTAGCGRTNSSYKLDAKALATHSDGSSIDDPCPSETAAKPRRERGHKAPSEGVICPLSMDILTPLRGHIDPAERAYRPHLNIVEPVIEPVIEPLRGVLRNGSPRTKVSALGSSPQPPPLFALDIVGAPTAKSSRQKKQKPEPPTSATWEAYSAAYTRRYGAPPTRNAKVSGQLKTFVEQWGGAAPAIAAFYLSHPRAIYAQRFHPIDLLLLDGQALKTQMETRQLMTADSARAGERSAASAAVWMQLASEDRNQ